jgi:hypothetical protein
LENAVVKLGTLVASAMLLPEMSPFCNIIKSAPAQSYYYVHWKEKNILTNSKYYKIPLKVTSFNN